MHEIWTSLSNDAYEQTIRLCEKHEPNAVLVKNDTLLANLLSAKGNAYHHLGNYRIATQLHQQALTLRSRTFGKQSLAAANSYHNLGNSYLMKGHYDLALQAYLFCKKIRQAKLTNDDPNLAKIYQSLGAYFQLTQDTDRAIENFELAQCIYVNKESAPKKEIVDILLNLGQAHLKNKYPTRALSYFLEAEQLNALLDTTISGSRRLRIYEGLSNTFLALKKVSLAKYYQKSAWLHFNQSSLSISQQIIYYNNHGKFALELQDYEQATPYFQKALELLRTTKDPQKSASCLNNLAICLLHQDRLEESVDAQERAISLILNDDFLDQSLLSAAYLTLTKIYLRQQKYAACFYYLDLAQKLLENSTQPHSYIQALILRSDIASITKQPKLALLALDKAKTELNQLDPSSNNLYLNFQWLLASANVYFRQQDIPKALALYKKSLHLLSSATSTENRYAAQKMESQIKIAECTKRMSRSFKDWQIAFAAFVEATKYQQELLSQIEHRYSRIQLWSKFNELYDGLVFTALKISEFDASYQALALSYSESFKSPHLKAHIFSQTTNNESFSYFPRDYSSPNAHLGLLKDLQEQIPMHTCLLKYHVGNNFVANFLVKRDTLITQIFPKPPQLNNNIIETYQLISTRPHENATYPEESNLLVAHAYQLYQSLISSIEHLLEPNIVIIPDDLLAYLPFEILLKSYPQNTFQFRKHDYFIRNHQISYALSGELYLAHSRNISNKKTKVLAISPSFSGVMPGLDPLFASKAEASFAVKTYGGKLITQANEIKEKLTDLVVDYPILHFSTHGILSDLFPEQSHLVFDEMNPSANLYFSELLQIQLPSPLVVLSACETGIGKRFHGEGMLSLENAFTAAGAKSIIASKWVINDKSSAQLITLFYEHLKSGKSKAASLQMAKLNFIDQHATFAPILGHPYYWSSLTLSGSTDPLPPKKWWSF